MGGIVSRIRIALHSVYTIYNILSKRLPLSPGVPVKNPSSPYWALPPSPIARHSTGDGTRLPEHADVVVIGSGITGTAFARTLLDYVAQHDKNRRPLNVVMLEARDACYGATARNGGHITPPLYHDYADLRESFGASAAQRIIKFRLAHLSELLSVATEENLLEDSQCRMVQTFDVFFDQGVFDDAKEQLKVYKADMPIESKDFMVYEAEECVKKFHLSPHTVGCLATTGGALHPYRFVTGILSRLLSRYPESFHLFTHTPCTAISSPCASTKFYTLTTPKGLITTPHVIHATNAWASHLLPSLRKKIVPLRATMTAQRPWKGLGSSPSVSAFTSSENDLGLPLSTKDNAGVNKVPAETKGEPWTGTRSFVFYPGKTTATFDFLTQQPGPSRSCSDSASSSSSDLKIEPNGVAAYPPPAAELMFGGGLHGSGPLFRAVGVADDTLWDTAVGNYLGGALEGYFCQEESQEESSAFDDAAKTGLEERLPAQWGGIIGVSADELPWVGRVPDVLATRTTPRVVPFMPHASDKSGVRDDLKDTISSRSSSPPPLELALPGEWIAAGYSGEGMAHAWMSGTALAYMVLDLDHSENGGAGVKDWFPDIFRVTEARWRKASILKTRLRLGPVVGEVLDFVCTLLGW